MIDPVREDGVLGNTWEGNEEVRLGRVCVVRFVVVCMLGCAEGAQVPGLQGGGGNEMRVSLASVYMGSRIRRSRRESVAIAVAQLSESLESFKVTCIQYVY